tara:strand:- start:427 stop:1488 length:1062 start_codon:yes stop_codon:yes gene_type:complete
MLRNSEIGIPDLRVRTDNTEEAREYNKMREAIISLASRVEPAPKPAPAALVCGFRPVFYSANGALSDGIGLHPGKLRFLQTPIFYEAPTEDNRADEVWPELNNTAINSSPPPRDSLAEGDWEAWVIFKEIYNDPEARIKFTEMGTGPGTLDRDEKAIRLVSFEVKRKTDRPWGIKIYEQNVSCDLAIWTDNHQFRAYKTDDDEIKVKGGNMMFLQGQSNPLVAERTEVADSSIFTITESGSIWLDVTATISRHSTTLVELGLTAVPDIRLSMYRIYDLGTPEFIFRGSSVNAPNPPAHGTNSNDVWTSSLDLHYEICRVELSAGGEVFITDQIADGPIWVTDLVDGALTPETS